MDGDSSQFNRTRKNIKCVKNENKAAMLEKSRRNTLESNLENQNTAAKNYENNRI